MSAYTHERAAVHILTWLHHAEKDLCGRVVACFDGQTGVVETIWLSEEHGLTFSFKDSPEYKWPVSTIKYKGP